MIQRLKYKLFELSGHLYSNHSDIINVLTNAVDFLGLRLGTDDKVR